MDKIWEFYENMNEIVYVSDIDTYDIIYMNKKAKQVYKVDSLENTKGQKCYELLQGCSQPCAICTNHRLRSGDFEEWKYFNPICNKTFELKDTMIEADGRRYRLELAIDISIQEQQSAAIKDYHANEAMINEGLRVALSQNSPTQSIEVLLEYFGKALKSERFYIFEEKSGKVFANTYEWCAKGVSSEKDNLQNVSYEDAEIWLEKFNDKRNVIIRDINEIKDKDPAMYEILLPQGINSLVVSPLFFHNNIIGFYGIDNPPTESLMHISTLFQIMGHFIVSLIRRRDLVQSLENMSFFDQLTGLGNRHSMNKYASEADTKKSIGVVYCDVTGLKKMNDTEGHKAGDLLLINAAECIKSTFADYSKFRIGGDEFLVLCSGITFEKLMEKTEELKNNCADNSVALAIGSVWHPTLDENLNKLLAEADRLMYEDKKKYYSARGLIPEARGVEFYNNKKRA